MNEPEMREKVINGLELMRIDRRYKGFRANFIPVYDILSDAIALLKVQEPRLVAESDFNGADEYGYIPVWTEEKDGDMYWECISKVAITNPDGIEVLRYWTSRPDQATREATPWN